MSRRGSGRERQTNILGSLTVGIGVGTAEAVNSARKIIAKVDENNEEHKEKDSENENENAIKVAQEFHISKLLVEYLEESDNSAYNEKSSWH